MINRRLQLFLKNVFMFFISRLYKEWQYIRGNDRTYNEKTCERGDLYVNQLIENIIHDRSKKYDPYIVNNTSGIYCGPTSAVLRKACVTGLNTLHRTNECFLTDEGNRVFINANLGTGPLTYQRELCLKFEGLERKIAVKASLISIKVSVDFSVEKDTGRRGLLLNFLIKELNGFNLGLTGFGYFDWVINLFSSTMTFAFGRIIRNLLENELEKYILDKLPKHQFPVEATSYRNVSAFKIVHKDFSNKETSRKKSKGHKSMEVGTAKESSSNLESLKIFREPQTNKRKRKLNSSPEQSLNLGNKSLPKDSCCKISKNESENNCDRLPVLLKVIASIPKSLNETKEKSIDQKKSWSQVMRSKYDLKDFEEDFSLRSSNVSEESHGTTEIEFNDRESATSSLAKESKMEAPENDQSPVCGLWKNIDASKMEESLQGSCRDLAEKGNDFNKNTGKSKLFEDNNSEIDDSCTKTIDEDESALGIKIATSVANNTLTPSTITEFSQIDIKIVEPEAKLLNEKTGLFEVAIRNDSEVKEERSDENQSKVIELCEDLREVDLIFNKYVSVESNDHCHTSDGHAAALSFDLKSRNAETSENGLVSGPEKEPQIEDSKSIDCCLAEKGSENKTCVSESELYAVSEDSVDDKTRNEPSDSISMGTQMIQGENILDSTEIETTFSSLKLDEKHEDVVNVEIPLKNVEDHFEDELSKISVLETAENYTSDSSKDSEKLSDSSNLLNEDAVRDNLLEKPLILLNKSDFECTYLTDEFWTIADSYWRDLKEFDSSATSSKPTTSVAQLKSNVNEQKTDSPRSFDINTIHNFIQEEIIAKTLKLKSTLEFDSGHIENSWSLPDASNENNEFEGGNRSLQDYLKANESKASCPQKVDSPSLSISESLSESDAEMTEQAFSERNIKNEDA